MGKGLVIPHIQTHSACLKSDCDTWMMTGVTTQTWCMYLIVDISLKPDWLGILAHIAVKCYCIKNFISIQLFGKNIMIFFSVNKLVKYVTIKEETKFLLNFCDDIIDFAVARS